jgi:hypothetical protein
MTSGKYIKALLYLALTAWAIVLYVGGQAINSAWLSPLSTVTTVLLMAVMAFDLWLWKLPFLQGWFVNRPVIDGTWRAELRSNWVDPITKTPVPPIEAYVVIRETFSTLSLRLMTKESSSELVGTEIVCSADGLYCISGVYRSEPRYQARERSPIHYGAVWIRIINEPSKVLRGHYWTDRRTAGEMELTGRQTRKFQDFDSAQAHYAGGSETPTRASS